MKRKICFLLVIIFLLASSGPAFAYDKDNARTVLTMIQEDVEQTNELLKNVYLIINWQVEGSKQSIEAYKEAVAKGETYEDVTQPEEVQKKADELALYIEQVQTLKKEIDSLLPINNESVDRTIEAAKMYFLWVESALNDLMSIFDFYFAQEKVLAPLDEFDDEAYGDDLIASIDALYTLVQELTVSMGSIDCPDFMQDTYNNYIEQINVYCSILETMYYAVSLKDVLRLYSADQLMGRMDIQIMKNEIALIEQFNLQYEKVETRLKGRVTTLNTELLTNCDTLINAIPGGSKQ